MTDSRKSGPALGESIGHAASIYRTRKPGYILIGMLYTKLLTALFRTWYGKPAEVPEGAETGLVLMADGVGGLDLCEAEPPPGDGGAGRAAPGPARSAGGTGSAGGTPT